MTSWEYSGPPLEYYAIMQWITSIILHYSTVDHYNTLLRWFTPRMLYYTCINSGPPL